LECEIKGVTHAPAFRVHSTTSEGLTLDGRQPRPPRRSRAGELRSAAEFAVIREERGAPFLSPERRPAVASNALGGNFKPVLTPFCGRFPTQAAQPLRLFERADCRPVRRSPMELRGVATRASKRASRDRASSPTTPQTSAVEASLQWVTARVPPALVREIEAHATRSGTTRSEAIRECLAVGMETIQHRDGVPGGRVEELLGAIESVRLLLELLGPPTFGTQRLLAHWATRDRAVKVSEDDLMAEVRVVSADEWEQAVSDAERVLGGAKNGPNNEEA
jgi:hypothetical protein